MALVKLDSPVIIVKTGSYYGVNTLCLPPKNISPTHKEYALTSGWGVGSETHLKIGARILDDVIQKSYHFGTRMRFYTDSIYENGQDLARVCYVSDCTIQG